VACRIVATHICAAIVGGMGRLGGQILFLHVGVVAVVVLLLRLTVPESPVWLRGREERRRGIETIRATMASPRALLRKPYPRPFLALVAYYALTNLFANTQGAFGTYLRVNVIGMSVRMSSILVLALLPLGAVFGIWFMRIVDTPRRMRYFSVGAIMFAAGALTPAVFGFSLLTIIVMSLLLIVGMSFAFEAIMKVWAQESFPTLLRSTGQGTIIAVARFAAAAFAVVTPALIAASPRGLFVLLAVAVVVGLTVAWVTFRGRDRNEFEVEGALDLDHDGDPDILAGAAQVRTA